MRVQAFSDAPKRLEICNRHPLTSYGKMWRCADDAILSPVLTAATTIATLAQLEEILTKAGVDPITAKSTLAWMLKYGIIEPVQTS